MQQEPTLAQLIDAAIPYLIVGGILLVTGIAIGLFIAWLRSEAGRKPEGDAIQQEQGVQPEPSGPDRSGLKEMLRVWRSRNGGLVFELDGELYKLMGDLSVSRHTRMVQLVDEMRRWLGTLQSSPVTPSPVQDVTPRPVKAAIESPSAPDEPSGLQEAPLQAPDMKISSVLSRAVDQTLGGKKVAAAAPTSMAAQVDAILQDRLARLSEERKIKLVETPAHGIMVIVDKESYDGVGQVPYPDVQKLLRECVSEWEKKNYRT